MIISEKNNKLILNTFIILIASSMMFRKACTILIIVFFLYSFINLKKNQVFRKNYIYFLIIGLPFLINLFFLWNNSSFNFGIKALEKYITLLIFPFSLILNYHKIDIYEIIKKYVLIFTITITTLFVRYIILYKSSYLKYQNGVDVWERGYTFVNSFSNHAPAINMHLSFVIVCCFYFMLKYLTQKENIRALYFFILTIISLYFLLYINTRLALLCTIIGMVIVLFNVVLRNKKKMTAFLILTTFFVLFSSIMIVYVDKNPYMKKKYNDVTFNNLDKIGKLDEVENAQAKLCNSLVTRLSIWKSTLELIQKKPIIGYGASESKEILFNYYKKTNQKFLYFNKFPVHNQFLDFTLKFGFIGFLIVAIYIGFVGFVGIKLDNPIITSFFVIFFLSNLTDDFLIRFDGIVYSAFWITLFTIEFIKTRESAKIKESFSC